MSQFAIIGEQEHARSVEVEATDGMQGLPLAGQEIHDGGAATGIVARGHYQARLMEHQNDAGLFRNAQWMTIDYDAVVIRVGFEALLGDDVAVDGDAACRDHLFSGAARGDASFGDELGNPFDFGLFAFFFNFSCVVGGERFQRLGWCCFVERLLGEKVGTRVVLVGIRCEVGVGHDFFV
jgi:hypothetical protein